jgi:response regulator RpfG family c-di-GMP phosphodiesterase
MNDELIFHKEPEHTKEPVYPPWKVLIVDDEEEVHKVTKLALRRFSFDGRPLVFISAYSGHEARSILEQTEDVSIILLDVVMETDHAGLDLVKFIRQDLNNHTSRIILRTGQPGQAPENEVITQYDINGYKAKTELTSSKLFTLMHTSLRSYRDIITLDHSKKGLEKVIQASRDIFALCSYNAFAAGALEQLLLLLQSKQSCKGPIGRYVALSIQLKEQTFKILASSTHNRSDLHDQPRPLSQLPGTFKVAVIEAVHTRANVFHENSMVMYCSNATLTTLFFVDEITPLSDIDRNLLNLFTENIVIALENIRLNEMLTDAKREIIYRLGEVIETRSAETGFHVKRVALYCELLAQLKGLSKEDVDLIKLASPLHDIGKVGIPDSILNKQGALTEEERTLMNTHAQLGHDLLTGSGNPLLDAAATISLSHHERWDGSGFPRGLAGDDIPIYGRIAALADVFDALDSKRCYKGPWTVEKNFAMLSQESGKQFDPSLVDLFMANRDHFLAIRERYQDHG